MKKGVGLIFMTLLISLFGCSNEDANASTGKTEASNQETAEQESITPEVGENTVIAGAEVVEPIKLRVGEPIYIVHPENEIFPEKKVEVILHGIDYLAKQDTSRVSTNESSEYLIMDLEINNVGENNISGSNTSADYPKITLHTATGEEESFPLIRGGSSISSFEKVDLIPGGTKRGFFVIDLEEGTEIGALYMETEHYRSEGQRPIVIDTANLGQKASEEPVQLTEQLASYREEFFTKKFAEFDNKIIEDWKIDFAYDDLEAYELLAEPNDIEPVTFDPQEYLSEFIIDEDGRFQGLKFTKQEE